MSYFPDSQAESTVTRVLGKAPALTSDGWIPEGRWPELDDLATKHKRLLDQRREVGSERFELTEKFEKEDAARHEELTAAMSEGRAPNEPKITPPEERRNALAEVDRKKRAADEALDKFLADAIAEIESKAHVWIADLKNDLAAAEERRIEAARILAEAAEAEGHVQRLRGWVERNGGVSDRRAMRNVPEMRYVSWASLDTPYVDPGSPEAMTEALNTGVSRPLALPVDPDDDDVLDVATATVQELADWIHNETPDADRLTELADGDAAIAQRFIDAEYHATNRIRPEVREAMNEIIEAVVQS